MLFKRKNTKEINSNELPLQDKLAGGIARFILSLQNRFAKFMSRNINILSLKKKQAFLLVFCGVYMGSSIYVLWEALRAPNSEVTYFLPYSSGTKMYENGSDAKHLPVNKTDMMRIEHFSNYMDSLKRARSQVYDSILKHRAGLMDSIAAIWRIHYSRSK